ncbi:Protein-lysine N-methyltransferase efm6 [Tilletia horrida]|nr:Protein-lysine N-methyltransferase efm6 [Tilletia horrida]
MDERERIRHELEEDERLDAVDPLRHLLHAGVDSDREEEEGQKEYTQNSKGSSRSSKKPEDEDPTATNHGHGHGEAAPSGQQTLRYKLNGGNDVVPAQRAAVEGDLRAVVRYFSSPTAPITFGLSTPPAPPPQGSAFFDVHLHQDVAKGCGGRIWPAAEVLGAYLAREPERWRMAWEGREVLELGSGTGLLGLLCARMGLGKRVLITDQDAMMQLMQRNLELNEEVSAAEAEVEAGREGRRGLPTPCEVRELNWGEPLPADVPAKPEVLLLADCVYLEIAFQPLVDTMVELSTPETEILFCYQKRRKADKRFFMLLKKHFHFDHVEDDDPARREVYNREGTQLLRVVKKR